jgi:hypothetical protein
MERGGGVYLGVGSDYLRQFSSRVESINGGRDEFKVGLPADRLEPLLDPPGKRWIVSEGASPVEKYGSEAAHCRILNGAAPGGRAHLAGFGQILHGPGTV